MLTNNFKLFKKSSKCHVSTKLKETHSFGCPPTFPCTIMTAMNNDFVCNSIQHRFPLLPIHRKSQEKSQAKGIKFTVQVIRFLYCNPFIHSNSITLYTNDVPIDIEYIEWNHILTKPNTFNEKAYDFPGLLFYFVYLFVSGKGDRTIETTQNVSRNQLVSQRTLIHIIDNYILYPMVIVSIVLNFEMGFLKLPYIFELFIRNSQISHPAFGFVAPSLGILQNYISFSNKEKSECNWPLHY